MFSDPEKNISQFNIDPGMKVADFGSGGGYYSLAVAREVGESGRVFAIDVQKDLLKKIKGEAQSQGLLNLDTIWADIDEPNGSTLAEGLVDRVLITNTLFQVENRENVIKEARRVLKPKGKVLIVDWSESFGGLGPQPAQIVSEDDVKKMSEQNNLKFERKIEAGAHHYGLIFKAI